VNHRQQVLEGRGRQREVGRELRLRDGREFLGGQRLQVEAAAPAGDRHLLVGQRKRHIGFGQRAQDVDELAGRNGRGRGVLAGSDVGAGLDLDLEVGGGEGDALAVLAYEDIGQDGQRLPPLDDAADDLQRLQQRVAGSFDQLHFFFPLFF
jgi:hypothetical protein